MKRLKIIGALVMLAGLCLPGHATILAPGGSGMVSAEMPGPAPIDTLITPYSFGGLSGTVTSWVVKDPSNPLGGLSFYYQISNTGSEEVSRLTTGGFGIIPGAAVNVDRILLPFSGGISGGDAPNLATRSPGAGGVVGFDFLGAAEIDSGQHSEILVVNTAYQTFQIVSGAIIDNNSFNVNLLGPGVPVGTAVPEASTFIAGSLLLIPFAASTLRLLRKR